MPHRLNSILIATLGSKAQIITLTLDLLRQGDELPGEVVVVHTRRDRPETAAALERLASDLPQSYPQVAYRPLELCDESGPLHDVVMPQEVDCAFRALYAEVRAAIGSATVDAFITAPVTETAPLRVAFTNQSTLGEALTAYWWDFGDGDHSTVLNPSTSTRPRACTR